ncbi:tegument protein UL23 [Cercopithecine betaherpesvirus 5]|uniref:Tegument protein UL23 n=1 Tax=Simian cytomegalovirus (strain Colburn) TaxID=50292 RepID=G8XTT0_SCMVC|nr:tegument protein UL23 [Cercopithecine betaherpesvirus 5]
MSCGILKMCSRTSEWKPGQHIPLSWPKDRVLVVDRRWRSIREGTNEEERLSRYLCCPEKLHFVGSICSKAFLKHKGGAPPSELYVGESGNVYLYVDAVYSDALTWIADDMEDFMDRGLRRCNFTVVPSSNIMRRKEIRSLVTCENLADLCDWRSAHASLFVKLGDDNILVVSLASLFTKLEMYYWRRTVGTSRVEPLGRVVVGERSITVFADDYLRFYAVREDGSICVVADTVMEFAARGLFRYRWSNVFYGNKKLRKLSGNMVCPAGKTHLRDKMEAFRSSLRSSLNSRRSYST